MLSIYVAESNFFNRYIHIEATTSCVSISQTQTARVRPGKATHGRKGSKREAIAPNKGPLKWTLFVLLKKVTKFLIDN